MCVCVGGGGAFAIPVNLSLQTHCTYQSLVLCLPSLLHLLQVLLFRLKISEKFENDTKYKTTAHHVLEDACMLHELFGPMSQQLNLQVVHFKIRFLCEDTFGTFPSLFFKNFQFKFVHSNLVPTCSIFNILTI